MSQIALAINKSAMAITNRKKSLMLPALLSLKVDRHAAFVQYTPLPGAALAEPWWKFYVEHRVSKLAKRPASSLYLVLRLRPRSLARTLAAYRF